MSVDSSRFAKTAKKTVRRGVSLYKVGASPYWYARIWNSSVGKYIVRSTKETSRLVAAEVAEELYSDLKQKKFLDEVPRTKTFIYFAEKLIKQQRRLAGKTRSSAFASDDEKLLKRNGDGIIDYFYKRDITLIRTSDITEYFNVLDDNRDKTTVRIFKEQTQYNHQESFETWHMMMEYCRRYRHHLKLRGRTTQEFLSLKNSTRLF